MNKLLTPQELADLQDVKPSTVYQWTHQGCVPHVKLGKLVRFRERDVMKWLDGRSKAGRKTPKIELADLRF